MIYTYASKRKIDTEEPRVYGETRLTWSSYIFREVCRKQRWEKDDRSKNAMRR